jgi:hypothetical protein
MRFTTDAKHLARGARARPAVRRAFCDLGGPDVTGPYRAFRRKTSVVRVGMP